MTSIHIMTLGNNIPDMYKTKVGITNNDLKDDGNNHLLSIIANTPEFSIFHNLIKLSKTEHIFNDTLNNSNMVNHNLNNSSTYTVFVPNNNYFDDFSYFLSEIDFATAREIVLYHVLKNTYDYEFFLGNSYRLQTISTNPMNQKVNVYSKKILRENTDSSIEYVENICLSNGRSIKHKKYSKHHMINEVMVIGEVEKTATNGKIYVINGLLKPPCCN